MARDTPQSFWDRAGSESHGTRPVQRLIDHCMSQGPDDRADVAVRRLLRHPSRFRSGQGDRGSAYRSAWRVLRRYSGDCSDQLFVELQAAVLAHWPVEERDSYRSFHDRERRESFWGQQKFDVLECNDLGLGQYLLLSAMSRRRLSPDARDRLGVFRRKYGAIKPLLKGTRTRGGGWVGTTIPDDRLPKVSDRNWLGIIRRDWPSRSRYPKQMGPNRLGEVSVEMFAGTSAAWLPSSRYGSRGWPCECRSPVTRDTLSRSFESPRRTQPPDRDFALRDPHLHPTPSGEQATASHIEAVIRRFTFLESDRDFAMSVCRAIEERHDAAWGDDIIATVVQVGGQPPRSPARPLCNLAAEESRLGRRDRGSAGRRNVVAQLCSGCCGRGDQGSIVRPSGTPRHCSNPPFDSLLNDPHAAVRAAALASHCRSTTSSMRLRSRPFSRRVRIRMMRCYLEDINHFIRYYDSRFCGPS